MIMFNQEDVQQNKVMGILAYIGILCLIPFFAAKESEYAQYHAKQGLNLFIVNVIASIVASIVAGVIGFVCGFALGEIGVVLAGIIGFVIGGAVNLVFIVAMVYGIIIAVNGEKKEIPYLAKVSFIK